MSMTYDGEEELLLKPNPTITKWLQEYEDTFNDDNQGFVTVCIRIIQDSHYTVELTRDFIRYPDEDEDDDTDCITLDFDDIECEEIRNQCQKQFSNSAMKLLRSLH